jgi:alcohol dehydrogenase (cytochrome c)
MTSSIKKGSAVRNTGHAKILSLVVVAGAAAFVGKPSGAAVERTSNPTYTAAQADAGRDIYEKQCVSCHGKNLNDGEAPALSGARFLVKWGGKSVYDLFTHTRKTMPASAPGSLSMEQYTDLVAYIFKKNILVAGAQPLSYDPAALKSMVVPAPSEPYGQLEPGIVMPPTPVPADNPLDRITPVTDAMLNSPPDGDWLTWRRTGAGLGYSPLKQINKSNVDRLTVAWSWSLPNGANEMTPLVHDGVLFVFGYGDVVQALNAATGDLLWEYNERTLSQAADIAGQGPLKKAIAIYGQSLFVPTSDGHLVALDVKTGNVLWEAAVGPPGLRLLTGGPVIAKGKVIIGTGSLLSPVSPGATAGGWVIAFDAVTGKEAWRFNTIPGPGEPGGNTWNDLPQAARSGGSIWVPGSYDPELNLVYFGTGQTYDTGPLRDRIKGSNSTNDGLYTDTTLAFNPDTGKLVWHYQHMQNDQWDFDWAFERQIMMLPVNGDMKKVVVTSGKVGVHDVLDAKTGKYLFSMDVGLQNFITAIDPKTGAKTYDPALIPDGKVSQFICPHVEGAKNWIPSSFNPDTKTLVVALAESCMYMTPVPPGERGLLSTGVSPTLSPRKDSDGLYGRLEAINLETRKVEWIDRQRAPLTSGVMATAGGLVFAGSLDRVFAAYDDATGKKLWSMRLNEVENSSPITYAVNGKQYIAVILGMGGMHSKLYEPFVPEIKNPLNRSSSVWVFELPTVRPLLN